MKGKKTVIFFLLAICICLFPARNAEAAVKYKNCFVKAQNGNLSYYNAKGKKAKGIVTVKGKKYYFDSKGVLRTGWRKINKKYYFFRQYNTRAGYMVTSSKVNGIRIRKNGSAVYNKTQLAKLNLMVKASQTDPENAASSPHIHCSVPDSRPLPVCNFLCTSKPVSCMLLPVFQEILHP